MTIEASDQDCLRAGFNAVERAIGHTPTDPTVSGFCPICGNWSAFTVSGASFRESLVCAVCYSTSRYRRLALGILRAIREVTGISSRSIAELPGESPRSIRLFDTQLEFFAPPIASYDLPTRLGNIRWIEVLTSSYRPSIPWGTDLGGTTSNQNLESLTFPDAHFDVVLTSDVMEHVRLYEKAHREIARVVKTGGAYMFTVPHYRSKSEHLVRVRIHDEDRPDEDEFVLPAEYHGSALPGEGPVLSYRVFGTDIDQELEDVGFDVEYSAEPHREFAVFGTELFYCRRR